MEITNLKYQVILTSIWCSLSIFGPSLFSQLDYPTSYENPDEVLALVQEAFTKGDPTILDEVSSSLFCNSNAYFWMTEKVAKHQFITNYREEVIEKEFLLQDDPKKLVVVFQRNKRTRSWFVQDMYYREEGRAVDLPKKAFSPLSFANYFNDFLLAIEHKKLDFFGMGPQGKLNVEAVDSLQLQLSNRTDIIYKNIILLDPEQGASFIYLRLKDYTCGGDSENCGWLIESMGSMSEFYKDDVYVQALLNGFESQEVPPVDPLYGSTDLTPFRNQADYEQLQEASSLQMIESPLFPSSFSFSKDLPKLSGIKIIPIREEQDQRNLPK